MFKCGRFEVFSVETGRIRLDGGAMFGVVPRVLWADICDVDGLNRIDLATRSLIAVDRSNHRVVVTDTGCGSKWTPDQAKRYAVQSHPEAIDRALAAIGLTRESVTDVIVTHLHFDHNGGLTDWRAQPGGPTVLRYPSAAHWIHVRQWQHARRPHLKDRASYFPQDFEALENAGVLRFLEGDQPEPTIDGVAWFVSHGHTPFQVHPVFGPAGNDLIFVGDLVPTIAHLRPAWVMAYDVEPTRTIDEKLAIYRRCLQDGLALAFAHDPTTAAIRLDGSADRPVAAMPIDLSI